MVRMLGEMNWELTSESEGGSYSPVDVGSPHPPEVYHANRGFEGRAVSSLSPSYSPIDYTPDDPDSPSDMEDDPEFREEVEASLIVPKRSGRDALGRKRPTDEDPGPGEDGGEGGAGSASSGEPPAPRRRRLRMDQVARVVRGAGAAEEYGTGRAPTDEERARRARFLELVDHNWPLAVSEGQRLEGLRAIQQWDQGTREEQDQLAETIAQDMEAFFGGWPMLRSVFEQQADRGGGVTAARRAEFMELIRRRWRPEKGAASKPSDEEAIRQWERGSFATQLRMEQAIRDETTARRSAWRRRVMKACEVALGRLESVAAGGLGPVGEHPRRTSLAVEGPSGEGDSSVSSSPELIDSPDDKPEERGAGGFCQGDLRREDTRRSGTMEGVSTKGTRLAGGEGGLGGDAQGERSWTVAEIARVLYDQGRARAGEPSDDASDQAGGDAEDADDEGPAGPAT